jgi:hypothetical protein
MGMPTDVMSAQYFLKLTTMTVMNARSSDAGAQEGNTSRVTSPSEVVLRVAPVLPRRRGSHCLH